MEEAPDEELMLAYRGGDAGAFDTLYARHRSRLFRFILRSIKLRAAAEELYQDVWMRVIEARASYQPTARFTTWLYTIAHNRLVDHWRRAGVDAVALDDEDPPGDDPGPQRRAEAREALARFAAALESLPAGQREVFLLHEEAGLTVRQIAAATGSNEEAAKSRLRYAIAKLRAAVDDGDERDPKLTQHYRELGAEEPSRELDQAILAAAHRAADRPHARLVTPAGRHRWYFALGAVALLVLAVAVTVHVERQQPDPESVAPAPATPARRERTEPQAAKAPKQAPAPTAADSVGAVAGSEKRSAQAPRAMEEAELPPERWLERVALLREQGRHAEADQALAEFRKRHPDFKIPDSMLQRIERK